MKKIAVIASGWHYASQFYKALANQNKQDNVIDLFTISHRSPEHIDAISEKESIRSYKGEDILKRLDTALYNEILTIDSIKKLGWNYIEKPNTIGDMEVFNQWCEDYDYTNYDIFLVTHDDNLILSNTLFIDIFNPELTLFKPIESSRYGVSNHQFKTEIVPNKNDWMFLDNGYTEQIPKAFTPRGSFCFYTKEFIDMLPKNRFPMDNIKVNRVNKTNSPKYNDITDWNTTAGNLRNFIYNNNLINSVRWFSNTKRISKYCIEGERGFIHTCDNDEASRYFSNLNKAIQHNNIRYENLEL